MNPVTFPPLTVALAVAAVPVKLKPPNSQTSGASPYPDPPVSRPYVNFGLPPPLIHGVLLSIVHGEYCILLP